MFKWELDKDMGGEGGRNERTGQDEIDWEEDHVEHVDGVAVLGMRMIGALADGTTSTNPAAFLWV